MKRRELVRAVAASGIASVAVGAAAGRQRPGGQLRAADLESVRVVRDGTVVRTVENPDESDLDRLFAELDDEESLVTPRECCYYECKSECAYCDYPPGCTDDCCCGWRDDSC